MGDQGKLSQKEEMAGGGSGQIPSGPEEKNEQQNAIPGVRDSSHGQVAAALTRPNEQFDTLLQNLENVQDAEGIKNWFGRFIAAWGKTQTVQILFRITETDEETFCRKTSEKFNEELKKELSGEAPKTIEEIKGSIREFVAEMCSDPDLGFHGPITEERFGAFQKIFRLLDAKTDDRLFTDETEMKFTIEILEDLLQKEEEGIDVATFIKEATGIAAKFSSLEGYSKMTIVRFYGKLTEKGRTNCKLLADLNAFLLMVIKDIEMIDALDTDFLERLKAIRGRGIEIRSPHLNEIREAQDTVRPAEIETFCRIYEGTGHELLHIDEEIKEFEGLKFTDSATRVIRLLHSFGIISFSWKENIDILNTYTDATAGTMEAIGKEVMNSWFYHSDSPAAFFKELQEITEQDVAIIQSLKKIQIPDNFRKPFDIMDQLKRFRRLGPLNEENVKVLNFLFKKIASTSTSYNREKMAEGMIRPVKNADITLDELKSDFDKFDTAERKKSGEDTFRYLERLILAILFFHGGARRFKELYESGIVRRGQQSHEIIYGAATSHFDASKNGSQIPEENFDLIYREQGGWDNPLEGILDLTDSDVENCKRLKALFPNWHWESTKNLPSFFKDVTENGWAEIKQRIASHYKLASVNDQGLIEKIVGLDEQKLQTVSSLLIKMDSYDEHIDHELNFAFEILEEYPEGTAEIDELISGASSVDNARLKIRAKKLFKNDAERFAVFEEMLQAQIPFAESLMGGRVNCAQILLDNFDLYGDDQERFKIIAYIIRNRGGHPTPDLYRKYLKEYGEEKDEGVLWRNYVKSILFSGHDDFTIRQRLPAVFQLMPELNFLEGITPENALFALIVLAKIDEEFQDEESQKLREKICGIIEQSRNSLLKELNSLRDRLLEEGTDRHILGLHERVAIKDLAELGIPNFRILERTLDYMAMFIKSPERDYRISDSVYKSSRSLMAKFAKKDRNKDRDIHYSHNDYASFYEMCISVNTAQPEALEVLLECFDSLEIDRENFEFMQEYAMKTCAVVSNLWKTIPTDEMRQQERHGLFELLQGLKQKLEAARNPQDQKQILAEAYKTIQKILVRIFDEGLGLKNLPEMNQEMTEHIGPFTAYLTNITHPDEKKRSLISFFLLLKILGKWGAFKRGEKIDVSEYLNDEMRSEIEPYLKERTENDIFPAECDGAWISKLAEKSEAIMIGESRGILEIIGNLEKQYRDLVDPDNFSDEEKMLLQAVKKFGSRQVGKSLSQRYKNNEFEDEVTRSITFEGMKDEKAKLPVWQKIVRILGALLSFIEVTEKENLSEKRMALETKLTPNENIIQIFRKIGEEMTTESGVIPVNEDIEHLEAILHKHQKELTEDELREAQSYLDSVKGVVLQLNQAKDSLAKEFMALHEASKKTKEMSERFNSRLQEFRKLFMVDESDRKVTLKSTLTGDLEDVIPHIRQCLGCQTQEINNDTNLTFGDRNRFLVITREFHMPERQSLSDQLVTVQKTNEEDEQTGAPSQSYSFVMDNVYGRRERDILVTNVLAVCKKLKELRRINPGIAIDIFVTDAALLSCGVDEEYLRKKLAAEVGKVDSRRATKEVHVAPSASGDGHYEIGGGFHGRVSSGSGRVGGIIVSV